MEFTVPLQEGSAISQPFLMTLKADRAPVLLPAKAAGLRRMEVQKSQFFDEHYLTISP